MEQSNGKNKNSGQNMLNVLILYNMAAEEGVDLFIDVLPKVKSMNIKVFQDHRNFGRSVLLSEVERTRGLALFDAFNYCLRRVRNGRCYSGGVNLGGD